MATETIDGVEFSVDMDTSGAIASTKAITAQNKKIEKSFNGIDTRVKKSSKAVKAGLSGVGRGAGQAGIQIQQFIGQVQGGQSAMLALSQQSADLGFVLGAPLLGAVVGISASIAGILLPNLFKTTEGIISLDESIGNLTKNYDRLSESQKSVAKTALLETIKKQKKEANGLAIEINKVQSELVTAQNSQQGRFFERAFGGDTEALSARLAELKGSLSSANLEIDENNKKLTDLSGASEKLSEASESITNGLNSQIIALAAGEEAAFRYATAQQLGLKVGEMIPASIDDQISALFRLKEAQDAAAKQKIKDRESERSRDSLTSKVQGLGLSPIKQVQSRLKSELELLRQAQEQKIKIEGTYEERRIELRRAAEERINAINKKASKDSITNFEALENQVVGTFASVASGAQDGKQAVASLAQSIATQLIGSLIKMGIQAVIGQTTAAATGVATAGTLAAAYAPAAALASLASFGANAAPASAGIASTVALSQGLAVAGGREHGGPVSKNSLYEVGEKNKPEMLMIPGNNGKVFSNSEMKSAMSGGGDGSVQVIINNNVPGVVVSASESTTDEGRMRQIAVQVVSEQSASLGSDMNRNINKNHNVTNRQGTNRRN